MDGVGFLATRVEHDGGVSIYVNTVNFVDSGVHLGNNEAGDVLKLLSKLVQKGSDRFAHRAPGGVELNEDIFFIVNDQGLEVFGDDDLNALVVLSGDILTLLVGIEGAGLEFTDELGESLNGEGLNAVTEVVLFTVVCGVKNADGGEFRLLNTHVVTKTPLNAVSDARLNEEDLALELAGCLREGSVESLIGVSVRSEKDNGGLFLGEDGVFVLIREVNKGRNRAKLEPF